MNNLFAFLHCNTVPPAELGCTHWLARATFKVGLDLALVSPIGLRCESRGRDSGVYRNILRSVLMIVCVALGTFHAHAATCPILSGASQSTIQDALNACGSGNTLTYPEGSFGPITSIITIPCGVSMTGPSVPQSRTPNQTATINGSSSSSGPGFQMTSGCSTASSITYLAWNGEQPSNGGGFLAIPAGTQNVTVEYNWIHGINGTDPGSGQSRASNGILLDGPNSTVTSNITIKWNIFGSTSESDCGTLMDDYSLYEINNGGFCNGVGLFNNLTNVYIENNIFQFIEQGVKFYEGAGECNNCVFDFNDFTNIHRIPIESQAGYSGSSVSQPTLMYVQFNDVHTPYDGNTGSYGLSMANGCNYPSVNNPTYCVTHTDENFILDEILVDSSPGGYIPEAIEEWGGDGTTASYNLIQGYQANGVVWAENGQFTDNYNKMILYFGNYQNGTFVSGEGDTNCDTTPGGWWNNEDVTSGFTPTCVGNTYTGQNPGPPTGTTTSVAPTISPASGSFSGSQTVTFTNPGTNRDTNTGIWYTTDGSTPVPGAGTANYIASGGTILVSNTTTVNAVGMWGAQNQPTSYPPSYGYVPSEMVSRVYTLSETATPPTLVSAYVGSKGGATTMITGGTLQFIAYGTYSDGTVETLPDLQGDAVTSWNTSNRAVAKISMLGHATAIGAGTANIEATIGTIQAIPVEVTVSAAATPPTLVSAYVGSKGGATSMMVGGTLQFTAYGTYSDGTVETLPDLQGDAVTLWNTSNRAVAKISTLGHATAIGAGRANIEATIGSIQAIPFEVTVSAAAAETPAALTDLAPAQTTLTLPVFGSVPAASGSRWSYLSLGSSTGQLIP
jgi:hypothetical protein